MPNLKIIYQKSNLRRDPLGHGSAGFECFRPAILLQQLVAEQWDEF